MSGKLVAFFSASGVTAKTAASLAEAVKGDVFEITPEIPYTEADLDWRNPDSRSSIEMKDFSSRPAILRSVHNISVYNVIYVGFPIWWYVAPTIINTFLEGCDLNGKTVIPFATSGGSGMGKTNEKLMASCKGAKLIEGKVWNSNASVKELSE